MSTASTPSAQQSRHPYLATRNSDTTTHTRSASAPAKPLKSALIQSAPSSPPGNSRRKRAHFDDETLFGTEVEPGDLEAGLWGSHDALDYEIEDADEELRDAEAKGSEWADREADLEEAHALDYEVAEHYRRFYRAAKERKDDFEFDQSDLDRGNEVDEDDDADTAVLDGGDHGEAKEDLEKQDEASGYSTPRNEQSDEDEPYRTASQPRTPNQLIEDLEMYAATAGSGPLDQDVEDDIAARAVKVAELDDQEENTADQNIDLVLPAIAFPAIFDNQPKHASDPQIRNRRFSDPELPSHNTTTSRSIGQHYSHRPSPYRRTSWSDFLPNTKSPPAGTALTTSHNIHAVGLGPYGVLGQETQIPYDIVSSRPEPIRTEQTVKSENGTFSLVWEENPGTDDADAALPEISDYVETPSYLDPQSLEDILQQISNPPSRNVSGVFGQLPAKTRLAAWSWVAEKEHQADEGDAGAEREEDPPGPPNTLYSGPSSAGQSVPHSPIIEEFVSLRVENDEEQEVADSNENQDDGPGDEPAETDEQEDQDPLALSTSAFTERQRSYSTPLTTHNLHLPTRPDSPYLPHPLSNLSTAEQDNFGGHRDSFLLAKQKYHKLPIRSLTSARGREIERGRAARFAGFFPSTASPGPPVVGYTPPSTWAEDREGEGECDVRRGGNGSSAGVEGPQQQRWNRWAGPVGAAGALERIEDASPPDKARAKGWMSAESIGNSGPGVSAEQEGQDDAVLEGTGAKSNGWKRAKYLRADDGTITLRLLDDDASEG